MARKELKTRLKHKVDKVVKKSMTAIQKRAQQKRAKADADKGMKTINEIEENDSAVDHEEKKDHFDEILNFDIEKGIEEILTRPKTKKQSHTLNKVNTLNDVGLIGE